MTSKCSVALIYEGAPKPMPLGITDDGLMKVLIKRQLIKEATKALHEAEALGDIVLIASFQSDLDKLQRTLDLVIPRELEDLYTTLGETP